MKQQSSQLNETVQPKPLTCFTLKRRDPLLSKGRKLVYDQKIGFAIKYIDFDQNVVNLSSSEELQVKIAIEGTNEIPTEVIVQLTTDSDLYFYYTHNCDKDKIQVIQKTQHFCNSLREYPAALIKVLNKIKQDPKKFNSCLTILSDSKASMNVTMLSDFKSINVLSVDFSGDPQQTYLQESIFYRYRQKKELGDMLNQRLKVIVDIIKERNPSLLGQIQKIVKK